MAIYEYYCAECKTTFEQRRPMSQAKEAVNCSSGHHAERTITNFAFSGGVGTLEMEMPNEAFSAGGCACGGACACAG